MSTPSDASDTDGGDILALLHDSAERTFAELSTKEVINAAESGTWPQALWSTLEGLGFTRAALPESADGSGLWLSDALTLARIAGRHALPLPLGETLIAGWLLAQAGQAVPEGPLSFGPVDRRPLPLLLKQADGWRLHGSVRGLPWGAQARRIALVLPTEQGMMVASVDPAKGSTTTTGNLAGEPRTGLEFNQAVLAAEDVRPLAPAFALDLASDIPLLLGALLRAQQMAGALESARDLAVRYTGERIAFGKPLNKLQAVQQNLAVLAGQAAAAGVAADMALGALGSVERGGDAQQADLLASVALAKVRTGEAAGIGAGLAHQAHGAIGFTYEHMLHHATRRLWSWRDEFGNEAYWSGRIGARIVAQGPDSFWNFITRAAQL